MEHVITILYGISGITATLLHLPQILKFHNDPEARRSISLVSWGGWSAMATVTILYALFVINSRLLATIVGLNVVAQLTVLSYGVRDRLAQRSGRRAEDRLERS